MAGHVKEFIDNCISSKVRPLVSGTSFATNITVKPHTAENMKNVPETPTKDKFSQKKKRLDYAIALSL